MGATLYLQCIAQVSERIVALDDEVRALRARATDAEGRLGELRDDNARLLGLQDELQAALGERQELLDEFEQRFARQYRRATSLAVHGSLSNQTVHADVAAQTGWQSSDLWHWLSCAYKYDAP
jgi:chromosome segregation ATPase